MAREIILTVATLYDIEACRLILAASQTYSGCFLKWWDSSQ